MDVIGHDAQLKHAGAVPRRLLSQKPFQKPRHLGVQEGQATKRSPREMDVESNGHRGEDWRVTATTVSSFSCGAAQKNARAASFQDAIAPSPGFSPGTQRPLGSTILRIHDPWDPRSLGSTILRIPDPWDPRSLGSPILGIHRRPLRYYVP